MKEVENKNMRQFYGRKTLEKHSSADPKTKAEVSGSFGFVSLMTAQF